ncbi:hypothetical protein C8R44DRAFT_871689 [Mycena epipterygia]|nr:hypothetical protein C8R44DRAFT_871689 [Mycena epipterygia]
MSVASMPADIAMITGPTLVGICLNWGFMGVLVVQIYFYHEHFPDDRSTIKFLVYGLAILDALQTVLITADAFHWFVYGFGNMDKLDETFLNSWDVPLIDSLISLVVQAFYCWRIYFLRKTRIIPALILLVSLAQCAAGIITAVKAHKLGRLSLIGTEVIEQTIWLVGGAVADVAIAVVLSWALLRERSSSLPATHSIITRAIRLIVETNALTAGVAVIALILFWGVPQHATLVVPPTAIIGKLYTNCLIAVFNNRMSETRRNTSKNGHGMRSLHLPGSDHTHSHSPQNTINNASPVKVHVVHEVDLRYEPIELITMRTAMFIYSFVHPLTFSAETARGATALRSATEPDVGTAGWLRR